MSAFHKVNNRFSCLMILLVQKKNIYIFLKHRTSSAANAIVNDVNQF